MSNVKVTRDVAFNYIRAYIEVTNTTREQAATPADYIVKYLDSIGVTFAPERPKVGDVLTVDTAVKDGDVVYREGNTVCTPAVAIMSAGTWSVSGSSQEYYTTEDMLTDYFTDEWKFIRVAE